MRIMIDFEKIRALAAEKLAAAERMGSTIGAARYRADAMLLLSLERLVEDAEPFRG